MHLFKHVRALTERRIVHVGSQVCGGFRLFLIQKLLE